MPERTQIAAGDIEAAAGLNPPGAIVAYGGATAPTGWLLCDGAAVSRTAFAALFSTIGTAFGAGDGSTTFNVPDLRGRFPLGKSTSGTGSTLGGTGGAIDHTHDVGTLAAANESAHTHDFTPNSEQAESPTAMPKDVGADTAAVTSAGSAHTHALSGATASQNPPFQAVNYIVKT